MKRIEILIVSLLLIFVQSGCVKEGGGDNPGEDDWKGSVLIQINKDKIVVDDTTRATEEPSGNEGKINSLVFYFFDASGAKIYEKQITASDLSNSNVQPDWNDRGVIRLPENVKPTIAKATSLYVIANEVIAGVTTKEILLAKQASGLPANNRGNFIMEGHHDSSDNLNPDIAPMVTIQLRRMATKVRLRITLEKPGTEGLEEVASWSNGLRYLLRNQIIEGYIVENKITKLSESNHTSDNILSFYDNGMTPVNIISKGGALPEREQYTYEHYWRETKDDQTYVLLQLPFVDTDGRLITQNYYKISLDKVAIQRNKIYEVTVQIKIIGSNYSDVPVEIQPSHISIVDWINVNIDAEIVQDYLYVPSAEWKMYGDEISFKYKASNIPVVYLTTAFDSYNENVILPPDEANADLSDFSKGEGMAYIYRKTPERFALDAPRKFYAFFHVRSIIKRIEINQFPSSYFGEENNQEDYYHIITPKDTPDYPVGYTIEYRPTTDEYVKSIQELANTKVSPDFYVQSEPIKIGNTSYLDTEIAYPKSAEDHCIKLQKATGVKWTLPSLRQWQLVAEACRILEVRGVPSPIPYGDYAVAQRSDAYYGYGVNIPSGQRVNFNYGGSTMKTRCVRNAE